MASCVVWNESDGIAPPLGHSAKSREWETPAENLQSSVAIRSSEIPLFSDLSEFVGSCREFVRTCWELLGLVRSLLGLVRSGIWQIPHSTHIE